ncbi:MAG: hypothetical protein N2C14_01340, partial [Planctomycetales bacterium]
MSAVSGTLIHDLDDSASRDVGEPGLPGVDGWTVYIDENGNDVFDGGETNTLTDANGDYTFAGLSAGTYKIGFVQQTGWRQTFPSAGTADRLYGVLGYKPQHADAIANIFEYDPNTGNILNSFSTPENHTSDGHQGLAVGGGRVWYVDGSGSDVHVLYELDPDTGAIIDVDDIPGTDSGQVGGLAYLDGLIYVENFGGGDIIVFNPLTDTVVTSYSVSNSKGGLTGAGDRGTIFDANSNGTLTEYSATGTFIRSFTPDYNRPGGSNKIVGGLGYFKGELRVTFEDEIDVGLATGTGHENDSTGTIYRIDPDSNTGDLPLGTYEFGGDDFATLHFGEFGGLGAEEANSDFQFVTVGDTDTITGIDFGNIDIVPPTVAITRTPGPNPTNASSVTFNVTFSEDVFNVTADDFMIAVTGTVDADALVVVGTAGDLDDSTYTVTVTTIVGDGDLGLDLTGSQDIEDIAHNLLNPVPTTDDVY